jgi:hypothetical protein
MTTTRRAPVADEARSAALSLRAAELSVTVDRRPTLGHRVPRVCVMPSTPEQGASRGAQRSTHFRSHERVHEARGRDVRPPPPRGGGEPRAIRDASRSDSIDQPSLHSQASLGRVAGGKSVVMAHRCHCATRAQPEPSMHTGHAGLPSPPRSSRRSVWTRDRRVRREWFNGWKAARHA